MQSLSNFLPATIFREVEERSSFTVPKGDDRHTKQKNTNTHVIVSTTKSIHLESKKQNIKTYMTRMQAYGFGHVDNKYVLKCVEVVQNEWRDGNRK